MTIFGAPLNKANGGDEIMNIMGITSNSRSLSDLLSQLLIDGWVDEHYKQLLNNFDKNCSSYFPISKICFDIFSLNTFIKLQKGNNK